MRKGKQRIHTTTNTIIPLKCKGKIPASLCTPKLALPTNQWFLRSLPLQQNLHTHKFQHMLLNTAPLDSPHWGIPRLRTLAQQGASGAMDNASDYTSELLHIIYAFQRKKANIIQSQLLYKHDLFTASDLSERYRNLPLYAKAKIRTFSPVSLTCLAPAHFSNSFLLSIFNPGNFSSWYCFI